MSSAQRLRCFIPHNRTPAVLSQLKVTPLKGEREQNLFKDLYDQLVRPHYPDSDDYAAFVLDIHKRAKDRYGYLTKKKRIWSLLHNLDPVGFTVVTEKRGGSIKFGPTILKPAAQRQQIGTAFRILVEQQYREARKAYNTLPDDNWPALKYVLQAGYRIEAHLRDQYRVGAGEIVVGKVFRPTMRVLRIEQSSAIAGSLTIIESSRLPAHDFGDLVAGLLAPYYDEIDSDFIGSLLLSTQSPPQFSAKFKRVLIAFRAADPAGIMIATPKRGGALKCSPLAVQGEDRDCMRLLLARALEIFPSHALRKVYFHVPLPSYWMLEVARSLGFIVEGVLREPYREGLDFAVLGRLL